MGLANVLLCACNEPARSPEAARANQSDSGVPGTPSGPRPSDEALNDPAQTAPVPLKPKAEAAADSTAPATKGTVPFVAYPGLKSNLDKTTLSPAGTQVH